MHLKLFKKLWRNPNSINEKNLSWRVNTRQRFQHECPKISFKLSANECFAITTSYTQKDLCSPQTEMQPILWNTCSIEGFSFMFRHLCKSKDLFLVQLEILVEKTKVEHHSWRQCDMRNMFDVFPMESSTNIDATCFIKKSKNSREIIISCFVDLAFRQVKNRFQ